MTTLIFVFLAMLIIAGIMAVGLYFGRAPIKGSCGGMSALAGQGAQNGQACAICGRPGESCDT